MCFDLTNAPVAATARAAATGPVSMSTPPDPEGSDTVEIATRRCPRLRVVWDLREFTHLQNSKFRISQHVVAKETLYSDDIDTIIGYHTNNTAAV